MLNKLIGFTFRWAYVLSNLALLRIQNLEEEKFAKTVHAMDISLSIAQNC